MSGRIACGLAALASAAALVAFAAPAASAHPLGNFSVNHLTSVSISSDRVAVHYTSTRPRSRRSRSVGARSAQVLRRKQAAIVARRSP